MKAVLEGKTYELVKASKRAQSSCFGCAFDTPTGECIMPECEDEIDLACLSKLGSVWKEVEEEK